MAQTRHTFVAIIDNVLRIVLSLVVLALAVAVAVAPSRADAATVVSLSLPVARSASFPHWCDWTWDVEQEQCWWDRSGTLLVGGDGVRTWRGAIAFDLSGLPRELALADASLAVSFGPTGGGIVLVAAPVIGHDWFREREPEVGPAAALSPVEDEGETVFGVTELVRAWLDGSLPNLGLVLKPVDDDGSVGAGPPLAVPATAVRLDLTLIDPG